MTDNYQALREALEAGPTPGPWSVGQEHEANALMRMAQPYQVIVFDESYRVLLEANPYDYDEAITNAAYAAACDPDTIRALLAERDALIEQVDQMTEQQENMGNEPSSPPPTHVAA